VPTRRGRLNHSPVSHSALLPLHQRSEFATWAQVLDGLGGGFGGGAGGSSWEFNMMVMPCFLLGDIEFAMGVMSSSMLVQV